MEKFNPKQYRYNLSSDIKHIRKENPDKAEEALEILKTTKNYTEAKETHIEKNKCLKTKENIEKKLSTFNHSEFGIYKVENINSGILERVKEMGFKIEKEVFVSLGNNEGFELLKAIDGELKRKNEGFQVYIVNEYQDVWRGNPTHINIIDIPIPLFAMPIANQKDDPYQRTIKEAFEDALKGEDIEKSVREREHGISSNYGEPYIHTVKQITENQCDLLDEWVKYLGNHFDESGFRVDQRNTDSFGVDYTFPESVSDNEKIKILFETFLKEQNVELILTSSEKGDYEKAIPVATEEYHILLNKDYGEFYSSDWLKSWQKRNEKIADIYGLYVKKIAQELLARPESILNEDYAFAKNWLKNQSH